MVRINPNRDECLETIRESIKGQKPLNEIIELCAETYPNVHEQTFYKWYHLVKKESDIEAWEDNQFNKNQDERLKKVEFKNQLYEDAREDYLKAKTEGVDAKLIQSLRQECRSYLKHY